MTDPLRADLLAVLERHEWTFGAGQCASCCGLQPGPHWQHYPDRPHDNGKPRRRFRVAELGHAPDCERAGLMRELGGAPVIRTTPPDPSKA